MRPAWSISLPCAGRADFDVPGAGTTEPGTRRDPGCAVLAVSERLQCWPGPCSKEPASRGAGGSAPCGGSPPRREDSAPRRLPARWDCRATKRRGPGCIVRRCMIRIGREPLSGRVEVDETYIGGEEQGRPGRWIEDKALVVIAAEEDGNGIGRIRLKHIRNASGASLIPFVVETVATGSVVHTDGWPGYSGLSAKGFKHEVTIIAPEPQRACRSAATGAPGRVFVEALALGHPSGRGQQQASAALPRRVHLSLQSAPFPSSR